ncbi:unnamed protein product [Symbiodinium microadriaticum]|nr:unnamed protein product [Symbiodinium sp. CCMP2456]CAE7642289.1 unnamed protein product [Symbiodinium microadriaticum]CAE7794408.1 unnamed protein product [Symbiodinium sp. KB8]
MIAGQQVSVQSARAIVGRLEERVAPLTAAGFLRLDEDDLKAIGFSRPKMRYGRLLAEEIVSGRLDIDGLAGMEDAAAIAALTRVKGIGPWTAEIYLLFALGRPDVWPVDDLALCVAVQHLKALEARPDRKAMLTLGEPWRPFRSAAARFLWHLYRHPGVALGDPEPVDIQSIDGPRHGPAEGVPVSRLVVFLHGLGADGNDLISLAPLLSPLLPGTAFVSPHAPFPCDMAPMGRQWFSLQDFSPAAMHAGAVAAAPILNAFLDAELARHGLQDRQLALIGFSQGTMMALHVALRRARPCALVVGFSGALVRPELLAEEVVSRPPVILAHGDADPVVPFAAMAGAESALKVNAVPVHTLARPGLGHGIDQEGLEFAAAALRQYLMAEEPPEARGGSNA